MAEATIPVDIYNPGQVFATLGLLETADVLCDEAEGRFDRSDSQHAKFTICTIGADNPLESIFEFLANAEVKEIEPAGTFPQFADLSDAGSMKRLKTRLPIRIANENRSFVLSHWCDGSTRGAFKLYSGNRSAAEIAKKMLSEGRGGNDLRSLWRERRSEVLAAPFDVTVPMGGSFNLDARGAWTAVDAGYSPNDQGDAVEASPLVEILAAIGLENARPHAMRDEGARRYRYGVWGGNAPPLLGRAALGCGACGLPLRILEFELGRSGKNKIITFSMEVAE
jgi:CRISPR-associated protein Csb3